MKILLICSKFPYPLTDGGAIAMFQMAKSYHRLGHEVVILAMNTPKHHFDKLSELPNEVKEIAEFYAVEVNTEIKPVHVIANLIFSFEPYHIQRFTSAAFGTVLTDVLGKHDFDVIQFETLFVVQYLNTVKKFYTGKDNRPLYIFRTHNVEHEIWERRAKFERNPWKRYYFNETHKRLRQFEKAAFRMGNFDAILTVSKADARKFNLYVGEIRGEVMGMIKNLGNPKLPKKAKLGILGRLENHNISPQLLKKLKKTGPNPHILSHLKSSLKFTPPIEVALIGLDMSKFEEAKAVHVTDRSVRLCYIGALDWAPNQNGLAWFMKSVWPAIQKKYPQVTLSIAGRRMPKKIRDYQSKSVEVLGEVPDAHTYLLARDIMIVPLQSGSGMRVKIVEGLALGRAIVATPVAAEGLNLIQGQHIMIAQSPGQFIDQLSLLIESPPLIKAIAKNGKAFVEENFDSTKLTEKLVSFIEKLPRK